MGRGVSKIFFLFSLVILFSLVFVSANIFDDLWSSFTGKIIDAPSITGAVTSISNPKYQGQFLCRTNSTAQAYCVSQGYSEGEVADAISGGVCAEYKNGQWQLYQSNVITNVYCSNGKFLDKISCPSGSAIGDVNGDGIINSEDALLTNEVVVGSRSGVGASCCLDANKDGSVTAGDALFISQIVNGQKTSPGTCNSVSKCTDSDGNNLTVPGKVTYNGKTYSDYCTKNILTEYTCEENKPWPTDYSCEGSKRDICSNGACVKEKNNSISKCIDSDGGLNYQKKGTVTLGNNSFTDSCGTHPQYLKEFFCDNSKVKSILYLCSGEECKDGVCVNENSTKESNKIKSSCKKDTSGKYDYACNLFKGEVVSPYLNHKYSINSINFRGARFIIDGKKTFSIFNGEKYVGNFGVLELILTNYSKEMKFPSAYFYLSEVKEDFSKKKSYCKQMENNNNSYSCIYYKNSPRLKYIDSEKVKLIVGGNLKTPYLEKGKGYSFKTKGESWIIQILDIFYSSNLSSESYVKFQRFKSSVSAEECNNGCFSNERCYPLGYRKAGDYCGESNKFVSQINGENSCENNFECGSNLCVNNQCINEGLFQKILDWFKKLFGGRNVTCPLEKINTENVGCQSGEISNAILMSGKCQSPDKKCYECKSSQFLWDGFSCILQSSGDKPDIEVTSLNWPSVIQNDSKVELTIPFRVIAKTGRIIQDFSYYYTIKGPGISSVGEKHTFSPSPILSWKSGSLYSSKKISFIPKQCGIFDITGKLDSTNLIDEGNESNNEFSGKIKINCSSKVRKVDYTIEFKDLPTEVYQGETVAPGVIYKNLGSESGIAPENRIALYWQNPSYSPLEKEIAVDFYYKNRDGFELHNFELRPKCGINNYRLKIDNSNLEQETNESNNEAFASIFVNCTKLPDLKVSKIGDWPTIMNKGEKHTFKFLLENIGKSTAFVNSRGYTLAGDFFHWEGKEMPPGFKEEVSYTWTAVCGFKSLRTLNIFTDFFYNYVSESNEGNNKIQHTINVLGC